MQLDRIKMLKQYIPLLFPPNIAKLRSMSVDDMLACQSPSSIMNFEVESHAHTGDQESTIINRTFHFRTSHLLVLLQCPRSKILVIVAYLGLRQANSSQVTLRVSLSRPSRSREEAKVFPHGEIFHFRFLPILPIINSDFHQIRSRTVWALYT